MGKKAEEEAEEEVVVEEVEVVAGCGSLLPSS